MNTLTCQQVRMVDQIAVEEFAMPSILLMENAGLNAARIIRDEYFHLGQPVSAVIFCGPGNNGGDGFVIARHLHNAGWAVQVILAVPADKLKGDALTNYRIVSRMEIPILHIKALKKSLRQADLVVDALLGTGFQGEPRPPIDMIIETINESKKPVVAIDVPSGVDCSSGVAAEATIRADMTITFVAAKDAFSDPSISPYVGKLQVADIGVPKELVDQIRET